MALAMRVLFATAEFHPVVTVGGLAAASAGLVGELRRMGVEVSVLLPDYGGVALENETRESVTVPKWAGPASVRRGVHAVAGALDLVSVPDMARPHPYLQAGGEGWKDNDARFFRFSQAVAALAKAQKPDVLHVNDWHTATALAALDEAQATVLSIHNLVYQGITDPKWLPRLGPRHEAFKLNDDCNPLAGGIALADRIVMVSDNYAREVLRPEGGAGLHTQLGSRASHLSGIRNGINVDLWDPGRDPRITKPFGPHTLWRKDENRAALRRELGLRERPGCPVFVVLTRLAHQKGIDMLVPLLQFFPQMPAQLAVLGAGDTGTVAALREAVVRSRGDVAFVEGYDEGFAHRLVAGGDMLIMPSRFEPCGLTQMEAMRYGTLPVATDVGGLHDTVIDLDHSPNAGNGWLAAEPSSVALLDALHRAVRGWQNKRLRRGAQRRAMTADWSWKVPAAEYLDVYARVARTRGQ
jgi:starch synthase